MKLVLDNAQSGGPHIDLVDDKGVIVYQIHICGGISGEASLNGKALTDFPEQDDIVLWDDIGNGY